MWVGFYTLVIVSLFFSRLQELNISVICINSKASQFSEKKKLFSKILLFNFFPFNFIFQYIIDFKLIIFQFFYSIKIL
jgi:hypothetical protein